MADSIIIEVVKSAGSIAGFAALIWRVIDEFSSFLRLSLTIRPPVAGWIPIYTAVENKGFRAKRIDNALLLIGPEVENPVDTARELARAAGKSWKFSCTNDFCVINEHITDHERSCIPIPFYFLENVDIADETLGYEAPIDLTFLKSGKPYSVRFFVFGRPHLHRSTHATLLLPLAIEEPQTAAHAIMPG